MSLFLADQPNIDLLLTISPIINVLFFSFTMILNYFSYELRSLEWVIDSQSQTIFKRSENAQ